jgi:hypothetical protein
MTCEGDGPQNWQKIEFLPTKSELLKFIDKAGNKDGGEYPSYIFPPDIALAAR